MAKVINDLFMAHKTIYGLIQKMDIDQLASFLVDNGWDCNNCYENDRLSDSPLLRHEKCDEKCALHCKEWLSTEIEQENNFFRTLDGGRLFRVY